MLFCKIFKDFVMPYSIRFTLTFIVFFSFGHLYAESTHEKQNDVIAEKKASAKIYGRVAETMDAEGYTYALIQSGKGKVWAAAPTTKLEIGDMLAFTTEMPMKNFKSNSLNRSFETLYFVKGFSSPNKAKNPPTTNKGTHHNIKQTQSNKPLTGISKVKNGSTIKEIYSNKSKMNGKKVKVRGKVTKFTEAVMNKNWIHIRDSSSLKDLTITTKNVSKLNDIVIIEGKLTLNKDFGFGYIYPIIVEDAVIIKN